MHSARDPQCSRDGERDLLTLPPILDALPTLMFIKDRNLRFLDVNKAVADLFGRGREDIIGRTTSELMGETNECEREDADVVRSGSARMGVLRGFPSSDGIRWFLSDKAPIKAGSGTVLGIVGTLTEVTAQVRLQEALRDAQARLKYITDHMADIVWTMDLQFNTTYVSPSVERILGFTPEERCRQSLDEMVTPASRDRILQSLQAEMEREAAGGDPDRCIAIDVEYYRKDGSTVWLENVVRSLRDAAGNLTGMLGVARDITELRQARIGLEQSEARMRRLAEYLQNVRERERTDLARDLHDELGQGLTALRLDLDLLRQRLDRNDPAVEQQLDRIIANTDGLSNDVRTLSAELRPGMLDDLGLCAAIEWQVNQLAERTGLRCALDIDCTGLELPATYSTALFRALQEALKNIVRHSEARTARVSLRQKDGNIVLTVSDDGRGITHEEIHSPASLGLIGLSERIGLLCGAVEVVGRPGDGTTVTVTLPLG
jgi:PAS domain S-box-containing protein